MARETQGRPSLRQTVQQHDAARAGDLVGIKTQEVADAETGGAAVACDPEANLYVSAESTSAFTFTGLDLDADTPSIERTFKRAVGATSVVSVALAGAIDGNAAGYTLDTAGASMTLQPLQGGDWVIKSATGTISTI